MSKVTVKAGPCGMVTVIEAQQKDRSSVEIKISTECGFYKPLETELTSVNPYDELFGKLGEGQIYSAFRKYCKHASCPVACGALKAVEIAASMALPVDPVITTEK